MSNFARGVLQLGGGNVAAQAISILAVPVITRLYVPAEFGAFSFVFSLVAVIFPIATLRFNSAMLLPKDERTAAALLLLSFGSVTVVALLLMPVLAILLGRFAVIDDSTRKILWFLVAGVLVHGFVHCFEFWLIKRKQYGLMAWGAVGESVADRALVIVMGFAQHAVATWLVIGRVVGSLVHLLIFLRAKPLSFNRPRIDYATLKQSARDYKDFPLYSSWAYLFANGGRELPTLVLTSLFSAAVGGMYALGVRVLGFPLLLIGDAVARVFLGHAIDLADHPRRLVDATRLVVRLSIYLIFPPMLLLSVFGPRLFELVFGAEWTEAGRYAQLLALSFLVTFLYRILSVFFDICDKQRMRLIIDAAQMIGRIVAMIGGGVAWGVQGSLWGLLLVTLLIHGTGIVYLLSLIGMSTLRTLNLMGEALLTILPISLLLLAGGVIVNTEVLWPLIVAALVAQSLWFWKREPRLIAIAKEWRW